MRITVVFPVPLNHRRMMDNRILKFLFVFDQYAD